MNKQIIFLFFSILFIFSSFHIFAAEKQSNFISKEIKHLERIVADENHSVEERIEEFDVIEYELENFIKKELNSIENRLNSDLTEDQEDELLQRQEILEEAYSAPLCQDQF